MIKIKQAKYQIVGLVVSLGLYLWTSYEWSKCPKLDCSESYIDHWLRTVESGSIFLLVIFGIFTVLPSEYFKVWFKYIFSWGFPLSVYMTYITVGSSSIPAYGKVEVVKFWGMFFVIVTAIFVFVQYWKQRRMKEN